MYIIYNQYILHRYCMYILLLYICIGLLYVYIERSQPTSILFIYVAQVIPDIMERSAIHTNHHRPTLESSYDNFLFSNLTSICLNLSRAPLRHTHSDYERTPQYSFRRSGTGRICSYRRDDGRCGAVW